MTTIVETIEDDETGLRAEIVYDEDGSIFDPLDPENDEAAADIRCVILHRDYQNPAERHGLRTREDCEAFLASAETEGWEVFALWGYEHGRVVYQVGADNPFADPWDSGRAGFIAVRRGDWGDNTREGLNKVAATYAAEYTAWANGEVYGVIIRDAAGTTRESCWGFLGHEHAAERARDLLRTEARVIRQELARELEEERPDLYGGA